MVSYHPARVFKKTFLNTSEIFAALPFYEKKSRVFVTIYKEGNADIIYLKPFEAKSETEDGTLDFTGAGDSFGAGFMASYVKERDMYKAARNGNATASLVIQKSGGCTFGRMPEAKRVRERIETGR